MTHNPYGNLHGSEMRIRSLDGRGLFAKSDIPKGMLVWINHTDGPMSQYPILTFDEVQSLPIEQKACILKYGSQLSDNTIQGPLTEKDAMLDYANFFNHSCDPNVWPIDVNHWEARRDISAGEELTIDYVTFDCNDIVEPMSCKCGTPNCRGLITATDYQNPELQKKYQEHFVPFIQAKIDSMNH